jgi:protein-S-isoprenylcysteine O-methyltransferase Ste14
MEGAAVQPGDDQRPVAQLAVHVGRAESGGTAPDGEARGAQVLRLHRQQPVDDLADTIGRLPHEQLGRQPTVVSLALDSSRGRCWDHDRDLSQGRCPEPLVPRRPMVEQVSPGAQVRLIPPVVYFGPFGVLWALHWWRPWTIPGGGALTVAGLALVLTGVALTVWSVVTLTRAHTTFIPWDQVTAMVTTGPFRFSRNPIYLADAIAYLGGTLLIHSWWPLPLLPGIIVVIRRKVIDREERYLTERFDDAYREYQSRVRRWL